jgi:hypothetical protein
MGKHKRIALHVLLANSHPMTAQQVAEYAYGAEAITLGQVDTVRRRVSDLHAEGWLLRYDHGRDPHKYAVSFAHAHLAWDIVREANKASDLTAG